MKAQTEESFWAKVSTSTTGCREWTGSTLRSGYGQVKWSGTSYLAHRLAAYLAGILPSLEKGQRGSVGVLVCHSCDNKSCCNPAHLSLGTAKSNSDEAHARGLANGRKGESHHAARLTATDVLDIRAKISVGEDTKQLALTYGITERYVRRVNTGERWGHLPAQAPEGLF